MTEVRSKICKGCQSHRVIHNRDYDGKTKSYCKKNQPGTDNCRCFAAWGVYSG